jgi:hypothetical protein
MSDLKTYGSLRERVVALREEMAAAASEALKDGLKTVFDQYPDVESISWTQYTPYFNDGDECVFGVGHDYPDINGHSGYTSVYDSSADFRLAQKAVREILKQIDDEDYRVMFGDHVQVTIHRDGRAEVEEYTHD